MKFDTHEYYKHQNCTDVFFKIQTVSFDDDGKNAILWGYWFVQGLDNYWCASDLNRIKINEDNYSKWKPYALTTTQRFT